MTMLSIGGACICLQMISAKISQWLSVKRAISKEIKGHYEVIKIKGNNKVEGYLRVGEST